MQVNLNGSGISVSEDAMSSEDVSTSTAGTAASITWVSPTTLGKKWDSELWSTDLFVVSHAVFAGKRKIKCLACEQLHRSRCGWESGSSFCLCLSTVSILILSLSVASLKFFTLI